MRGQVVKVTYFYYLLPEWTTIGLSWKKAESFHFFILITTAYLYACYSLVMNL